MGKKASNPPPPRTLSIGDNTGANSGKPTPATNRKPAPPPAPPKKK